MKAETAMTHQVRHKQLPANYPHPDDPYWQVFDEPERAYWNLFGLVRYYREGGTATPDSDHCATAQYIGTSQAHT